MPELRMDPLTGRLVSYAPERAKRPHEIGERAPRLIDDKASCPFCPGREEVLAPATLVLVKTGIGVKFEGEDEDERKRNWIVKCIPNLYPAFSKEDMLKKMEGVEAAPGRHEVLIDTPDHEGDPWALSVDQLQYVLLTARERVAQLEREPEITYASFGKNQGPYSGGSLRHPHSHILASSITPPLLRIEAEKLLGESCVICRYACDEISGPRAVLSTRNFAAICPWASREPYELLIFPKSHLRRFADLRDSELLELSSMLSTIFKALRKVLGDQPSFNLIVHTKPKDVKDFHWHIEIIPRTLIPMVAEIGLEVHVNTMLPEKAAENLRQAVKEL